MSGPGGTAPDPATAGAAERAWWLGSRWGVPVMMTLAYALLAATSDTDLVGKAWMGLGLGLVLVVWFVFRALTETAGLARALSVGDAARLFALADRHLARRGRPIDRAPFLVGRALGRVVCGDFVEALAALDQARPGPAHQPVAAVIRVVALVELGRPVALARAAVIATPVAPAFGWLADGVAAWHAGELDAAAARFAQVIGDVRGGSLVRAIAHVYAGRSAVARGEPEVAARHRTAAAGLATPEASWLRGGEPPAPQARSGEA
jgi:hypothetical protein